MLSASSRRTVGDGCERLRGNAGLCWVGGRHRSSRLQSTPLIVAPIIVERDALALLMGPVGSGGGFNHRRVSALGDRQEPVLTKGVATGDGIGLGLGAQLGA